jgi:acyl-CoA thioesterase-2
MTSSGRFDLADLLALLDVEEIDRNLYRAINPDFGVDRHLYGGQVAAQALRAAALTVGDDRFVHSTHGYFLRLGRSDMPTILHVHRDRDGRSYSHRRVEAVQNGEVIFSLSASFNVAEQGPEMEIPAPEGVWDVESLPQAGLGQGNPEHLDLFEIRVLMTEPHPEQPPGHLRSPSRYWVRPLGTVGDDPVLNACIVMYFSDMGSGFSELDLPGAPFGGGPTLDHSVWFHRPVTVDQWLLLHLEPVIATRGRGLYRGGVYDRSGRRLATVNQEIVLRSIRADGVQRVADLWKPWQARRHERPAAAPQNTDSEEDNADGRERDV